MHAENQRQEGTIIDQQQPAAPTRPHIEVPPQACDSHIHILDYRPQYPMAAGQGTERYEGTMERYRSVQRTLGTQRVVVVHTALYEDNRLLLDTLRDNDDARGIAIVGPHTSDEEWRELEASPGVRGVRITTRDPESPQLKLLEPLAERITPLGWHLQIHVGGQMLVDLAPRLAKLPGTLVIDHFGRIAPQGGVKGEEFKVLAGLISSGRVYCKLSAPNRASQAEPPYDDIAWIGRALVDLAPERMVWGTDWPNINWAGTMPDAGMLLDCLATWAPDPNVRKLILVDNPATLYRF